MKKIINKGLNELGAKTMNKLFERNNVTYNCNIHFTVGDKVGQPSKILTRTRQLDTNPNSITMGSYWILSMEVGRVSIPLEWLNYEIIEYVEKVR